MKGEVKRKTVESILTFNPGVISFSVIANCVRLYLVWYSGVGFRFHKRCGFEETLEDRFPFPEFPPIMKCKLSSHFPNIVATVLPFLSSTTP